MLHVHRSNRAERLVDSLAALVAEPLADPWLRETIVVQGRGMERWLSMELSRRLGVWAHPSFPFPRTLLGDVMRRLVGADAARAAAFEPEALLWRIALLLPELSARAEFAPVRSYLEGDERGARRFELAAEIAAVFDRYVLYRPEMIAGWERGGGEGWQPALWRALCGGEPPAHLAARVRTLIERLRAGPADLPGFPARVSVFGLSTLAPLYLHAFAALGRSLDVHFFLLAPSREFVGDLVTPREEARLRRPIELPFAADLHLERGHPLVASLGKLGADFQQMLEEIGYDRDDDLFEDPAPSPETASVLAVLQSDILHLRNRRPEGDAEPLPLPAEDDSVRVHACHSPMREVEVLHDQLLALFDAERDLEPRDVAVLVPSIDDYAPYVDAVFCADPGRPSIPYHVADRRPRGAERVVDAFLRILEVLGGRLGASEVFDLLAMDVVRERFAISVADLDRLRHWIDESGIRWGVDAEHRVREGQPAIAENTWQFGLDRLLLGLALPAEGSPLYGGVLPVGGIEGEAGELLGALAEFCATLFSFRRLAERPATAAEHERELGRLLDRLIALGRDDAEQHRRIRRALERVAERAAAAGFVDPLPLEAFVRELEKELAESAATAGFLSAGVTFCALLPMRAIPFRVVCVLGMSDGAFPRIVPPPGFDLTAAEPRRGDRTRRDDDRMLFLETLLSARRRLLLSYVGRSIQDNSEIPPSVVVSELLEAIASAFTAGVDEKGSGVVSAKHPEGRSGKRLPTPFPRRASAADRTVPALLLVRHPLQAFSEEYFRPQPRDPRLFSYSIGACAAARADRGGGEPAAAFVDGRLPPPEPPLAVSIEELERFLRHPARWFCRSRLGLELDPAAGRLEDREPLELDALAAWAIGDRVLERLVEGASPAAALAAVRAAGLLPPAAIGEAVAAAVAPRAARLAEAARGLAAEPPLEPIPVALERCGVRLSGFLRGIRPRGQVDWRYSRLGGRHEACLWLRHLLLHLAAPPGVARRTRFVGSPAGDGSEIAAEFHPVKDAAAILDGLLALYRSALEQPPPLLPNSSRAYAEGFRAARGADPAASAAKAAARAFRETREGRDPYVQKLFGAAAPTDDPRFAGLALGVFAPLLEHRGEGGR